MVKDGSIVHIVLEHGQPLVLVLVDLAEQVELLELALEDELAIGTDMPVGDILALLVLELLLARLLLPVVVALQPTRHSKVVHEERMLVDVLEDAELALIERELEAVLEVQVRVQASLLVLFLGGDCRCRHLAGSAALLHEAVQNVRTVERLKILVLPVELEEGQILDAVGMVELVGQHCVPGVRLVSVRHGLVGVRVRVGTA